ncbi:hypothetical protein [Endozoicomonas sp. Mp262]|uniref:hypothetical protein n=1 Tax=Endozoicomonas sp. Mp262 TaxID=2919499 RepID=UPI0021DA3980
MLRNDIFIHKYMHDDPYNTQVISRKPDLCLYQPDEDEQQKTVNSRLRQNILRVLAEKYIPKDSSDAGRNGTSMNHLPSKKESPRTRSLESFPRDVTMQKPDSKVSVRCQETGQLTVDVKPAVKNGCSVETKELLKKEHKSLLIGLFDALGVVDFSVGLKPFYEYFTTSDVALLEKMISAKLASASSLDEARLNVMELYLNEISKKAPEINDLLKYLEKVHLFAASKLLKSYFKID